MTVADPIGSGGAPDDNTVARWFRETPVTMTICAFNVVTWIAAFFSYSWLLHLLVGVLDVSTAWKALTYPLGGVGQFEVLAINVLIFGMFARSLERGWGSLKFAQFCVIVTLISCLINGVGNAVALGQGAPYTVAGLTWLDLAVIVTWCGLHRGQTLMFLFVLPMQAWVMAVVALVMGFFTGPGPIHGAFLVITPILCWFWVTSSSDAAAPGPKLPSKESRTRARKKKRFKVLEGGASEGPRLEAPGPRPNPFRQQAKAADTLKEDGELDRILDKIRFEGMEALSEAEKATLDKKSQSLRERD